MLTVEVEKSLGGFRIEARFEADSSGITVLFGRSGCGKTSIVNMIAGLSRPDRGRIAIDGRPLFDGSAGVDLAPERRRVGYVFQDARLFPHLSVRANLTYGRRFAPHGAGFIAFDQAVGLLGLEGLLGRRPARLSGGERQRVAIGRALLAAPRLLLMDEPLGALDAARRAEILPYIERLRDRLGLPIVYVSHATEEVVRLADTLVLMSDGQVAAAGPVEEIMSRLDLRPLTGRYEAGSVVEATVAAHDPQFGLTSLDFGGGRAPGSASRRAARARRSGSGSAPATYPSRSPARSGSACSTFSRGGWWRSAPRTARSSTSGSTSARRFGRASPPARWTNSGSPSARRCTALVKAIAIDRRSLARPRRRESKAMLQGSDSK